MQKPKTQGKGGSKEIEEIGVGMKNRKLSQGKMVGKVGCKHGGGLGVLRGWKAG